MAGKIEMASYSGKLAGKCLKAIELLKLPADKHYDGGGLFLNVAPSGSRSWILRTMVNGKRAKSVWAHWQQSLLRRQQSLLRKLALTPSISEHGRGQVRM